MAEIVAGLVGPVVEHIGKFIAAPIKREFTYLCCFKSNTQSLSDETEKLNTERDELQMKVDRAKRNNEVIVRNVQKWLDDCGEIQRKTSEIQAEITNPPSGCLAMRSRYLLSKKAKNTANDVNDLLERCKFVEISHPAPPPGTVPPPMPLGPLDEFPSRKQIAEKIMEDLRGGKIYMMGLCGMGGVGKTTMAKRIMDKVWEEKLFDEVVMATVSQPVDQREIQGEIASSLGLELKLNDSLQVRADNLCTRLMAGKKILLILDDVWEELDLKELGIPCKSDVGRGCTIVLTSRNKEVLNKMDARPYAMEILSEEEAWFLFREKVGTWVELSDLRSTANEVAKECKGLPLALTVVGSTLKNEKGKEIWEDSLHQLKTANPEAMPDVLNDVYKPLKMSYVSLKNQQAESLFLLCCIFPEDHNIHLEYLTLFGIGLRMFEGMSLEEARNRVCTLLKMLQGRFLLLNGRDENHVKMHDVVRDVAIFIAFEEGCVVRNLSLKHCSRDESINCRWISVIGEHINKLPIDLSFPSLRLLLMYNPTKVPGISIIPSFFQGMKELNVLYFCEISCRSLPETTQLLKNLRTLYLDWCGSLETISIVGQLLSLEILICRHCDRIAELPVEIGRLERLKLLEISECQSLKRIAPGVISKFVQLEELIIVESFAGWERKANGEQRDNAALCELEHLKNLTTLDIEIKDLSLVTEEMCFSTKIVNYHIRFMSEFWIKSTDFYPHERGMDLSESRKKFFHHERGMDLILKKDITLARWIHVFLRSTHSLATKGDGSNSLDLVQGQNLTRLVYKDCSTVNKLVNITKASNSFGNLKELSLFNCPKLSKLFPLSMAKDGLLLLEKLKIEKCEMMEDVFANEENEKDGDQCHMITFHKLKYLMLSDLPRLTTFCKGSESIIFPLLNGISIKGCGNLKSLVSGSCNNLNLEGHDADSLHLFCHQKVSFVSLMNIEIGGWGKCNIGIRRSLFSSSITENLVNLKKLTVGGFTDMRKLFSSAIIKDGLLQLENLDIRNCEMMEEVFSNEENGMDGVQCHTITFPKLKYLELRNLPRLTSFCKESENIEFPLLEKISFEKCGNLTISSTCDSLNLEDNDHNSVHIFCNQKVSFGSLMEIMIERLDTRKLFSSAIIKDGLLQLEKLDIRNCEKMEEVFSNEENGMDGVQCHTITFPKLKSLSLSNLPRVTSFCKGSESIEFPLLEQISIHNCDKLTSLIYSTCDSLNMEGHDHNSVHLFCNQKVSFGRLERISVYSCNGIRSLFSSSIAAKFVNLKELDICDCNEMVKVIEDSDEEMLAADRKPHCILLPSLEHVSINKCPLLEFFTMESVSFGSLMEIMIEGLDTRKLFSSAIIKDGLLQLEKLDICNCEKMEEVLSNEENGMDGVQCHTITFPKLKSLDLACLPRLTSFCKGSDNIEFPLLEEIVITKCKRLTSLISSTCDSLNLNDHDDEYDSVHLFCNQKVSFGRLERISVDSCNGIRSLFSSSIAAKFVNLKQLDISDCNEMVKVIEDSDEEMLVADQKPHCILLPSLEDVFIYKCPLLEFFTMESVIFGNLKEIHINDRDGISSLFSSSIAKKLVHLEELTILECNDMVKVIEDDEEMLGADQNPHLLFHKLKYLDLRSLPKLHSFCNWGSDLILPSLEKVLIERCPLLEFFTMGSVSTPNLELLRIDYRCKDVGDLNSAIQQLHFETNQHQPISTPKETTSSDEEESETDQPESKIEKTEMEFEEFTSARMKE